MKAALIVGIDHYTTIKPLRGAVNDARAVAELLKTNDDGTTNFEHVKLRPDVQHRHILRAMLIRLFNRNVETALFYFAGHGTITDRGGYLITPDFRHYDEGISMDEILSIANQSRIRNKIIIVDCCYGGNMGNPAIIGGSTSILAEGVSILTSCRNNELAVESGGNGVFTRLLIDALKGGAADVRGRITPGSVYAYIDQSLDQKEQRPLFKSNVSRFIQLRNARPPVSPDTLKMLSVYFNHPEQEHLLDPSYEFTNTPEVPHDLKPPYANPANVKILKHLQQLERVGLIVPVGTPHMYFAAMESKSCRLTALGQHYWRLVREGKL
jgi:hypothetical protein